MIVTPVGVLAVDDAGLVRMEFQTDRRQSLREGVPHLAGLFLAVAVNHRIIAVAFERDGRVFPDQPHVHRIVGSPRGFSPRGSHGTERDTLASFRSSHPIQENTRTQAQWANIAGSLATSPSHQTLNRRYVLSRLNFFRAHRVK